MPDAPHNAPTKWRELAACRNEDTRIFFPTAERERGTPDYSQAASFCARCVVREPCLQDAFDTHDWHGFRGGMTGSLRNRRAYQKDAA